MRRAVVLLLVSVLAGAIPAAAGGPRVAAGPALVKHIAERTTPLALPASLTGGHIGGIAVDAAGNLYAAVDKSGLKESATHVVVWDPKGNVIRQWPSRTSTTSHIYPVPIAVGPDGLVYVPPSETGDTIEVFRPDGTFVREFGAGSHVSGVRDIDVDAAGNVYVLNSDNPRFGIPNAGVVRFDAAGRVSAIFQPFAKAGILDVRGVAAAPDGTVWVTSSIKDSEVIHLDANGKRLPLWSPAIVIPGSSPNQFRDVAFVNGNLYLAGSFADKKGDFHYGLAEVTPDGQLLDRVVGDSTYIAAGGGRVYLNGKLPASAPRFAAEGDGIVITLEVPANQPALPAASYAGCSGSAAGFGDFHGIGHGHASDTVLPGKGDCTLTYVNFNSPCPNNAFGSGGPQPYLGGRPAGKITSSDTSPDHSITQFNFDFSPEDLAKGGGSVVIKWTCAGLNGSLDADVYEFKGDVYLLDPSGTVVDKKTGKPVAGAIVRLEFAPAAGAPFGAPGLSGISPQLNPETTDAHGTFSWDVAPGSWRLVVAAFGYKPLTSKAFAVPPPATNIKLELTPDAAVQKLLIDPAGRVGPVRLHAKPGKPVAGLKLKLVRKQVAAIAVRSSRFRTALRIGLGSTEPDFVRAYGGTAKAIGKGKSRRYRITHATFTVTNGRITAIALA